MPPFKRPPRRSTPSNAMPLPTLRKESGELARAPAACSLTAMDRPADSAAERRIENITRQPDQPLAMLVDLALGSGPEPEGWWSRGRPSPRLSFAQLRTPAL